MQEMNSFWPGLRALFPSNILLKHMPESMHVQLSHNLQRDVPADSFSIYVLKQDVSFLELCH